MKKNVIFTKNQDTEFHHLSDSIIIPVCFRGEFVWKLERIIA